MMLKHACNAIMTWVKEKDVSEVDTDVITENEEHDERYNELKEIIQQCYIDERLERRDQQLMGAIREIQEDKRVLLETAATNKKPWWKFW
ncbi:DUF3967 domain-containing protein [Bacillus cereus]|nr:DUF3967 domain-containing protein [Bacillus cereus]PFO08719.1 hypothetical protein COJ79_27465 [Bacillus thuringiensis]